MTDGSGLAYTEVPVFFDTSEARLFGIVTLPVGVAAHTGLVILPGAGTPFTVNRNRLSVRLGRELAPLGYAVLRCDYHGVGESTGTVDRFHLSHPFTRDVVAGVSRLREMGVQRVILAGSCFGGRCALAAAADLDDVEAVVLLATSVRDYARGERKSSDAAAAWGMGRYVKEALRPRRLRGLLDPRARRTYGKYARAKLHALSSKEGPAETELVSPVYERPLRSLIERRVPILQVFGEDDSSYEEYRAAAAGPLADVLTGADRVEVRTVPGKIHGFLSPPIQDAVLETLVAWAAERRTPEAPRLRAVVEEPAS